jgi:phosphoglycolate phosphatase-like HAD superfamily hydrolase
MIKNILFDFDGVIVDSMPIRDLGFREIFKDYDEYLVEKLIKYHNINGGLSRYVKIKYFYEELLKENVTNEKVEELAAKFSEIMKEKLVNKDNLIVDTIRFIKNYYNKYNLHIVSGSDGVELKYLCEMLKIEKYFLTINGSPTPKTELIAKILQEYEYLNIETILIGDSINDYEAAQSNSIDFYGYNNIRLIDCSKKYLNNYMVFE